MIKLFLRHNQKIKSLKYGLLQKQFTDAIGLLPDLQFTIKW